MRKRGRVGIGGKGGGEREKGWHTGFQNRVEKGGGAKPTWGGYARYNLARRLDLSPPNDLLTYTRFRPSLPVSFDNPASEHLSSPPPHTPFENPAGSLLGKSPLIRKNRQHPFSPDHSPPCSFASSDSPNSTSRAHENPRESHHKSRPQIPRDLIVFHLIPPNLPIFHRA